MYTLNEEAVREVAKVVSGLLGTCKDNASIPLLISGISDEQMVTFMANNKGGYQLTAMLPLGQDINNFSNVVDASKFTAKLSAFQALKGSVVVDEIDGMLLLSKEGGNDTTDMPISTAEIAEFTPDIEKCIANFTCEAEELLKCVNSVKLSLPEPTSELSRDNIVIRLENNSLRMLVLGNKNAPNTLRECAIKKGPGEIMLPLEGGETLIIDINKQAAEYLQCKGDEFVTFAISKTSADVIGSVYSGYSGLVEVSVFPSAMILSLAGIMLQIPLVASYSDGYQHFLDTVSIKRSLCIGVDGNQLRAKVNFLVNNFKLSETSGKKEVDQRICLAKKGDEINISIIGDAGEHAASILSVKNMGEPNGYITVRAKQLNTVLSIYGSSVVLTFEPGNALLLICAGEAGDDKRGALNNVSLLLGFPDYSGNEDDVEEMEEIDETEEN